MKRIGILMLVFALAFCFAAANAEEVISAIMNAGTTQAFTKDAIPEDDLTAILEAGLSATSAINQQPWFFAVITNEEVMNSIGGAGFGGGKGAPEGGPQMPGGFPGADGTQAAPPSGAPVFGGGSAKAGVGDSPVAVVVYLNEAGMGVSSFDCGLACQNMFIAANALGYGAKIVSSPTMTLNGADHDQWCEKLGVDPAYTAVAVLLIGVPDSETDAVTSATERDPIDAKVSFVK